MIQFSPIGKLLAMSLLFSAALPLAAQTYTATGGTIPDDGSTIEFPLVVSGLSPTTIDTSVFGLETVCINITHTWDSDLEISLVAPDGTTALLLSGIGGDGDNFTNTCLNVTAAASVSTGSAPFTGTWKPMGVMGLVNNGQVGNGTWLLRIHDTYPFADTGDLLNWSITFGSNPATYLTLSSSNLPLVIINTAGVAIPDEPKIPAGLKIIDNGPGLLNHPGDTPAYEGPIGIEQRGNFSAAMPQKPWGFETRDGLGAELDTALLGMPSEHDWILLANYNDKVFCRNILAFDLFRRMGHWAPRTRLCEVILNGEYQGIYVFTEKIKRDKNRVDIPRLDSTDISGVDLTGGYIFKNDYWDASNSWLSPYHPIGHPTFNIRFVYYYPDAADMLTVQKDYLRDYVTLAEDALYGPDFMDPVTGYRAYINDTSFMDYFFVNELARNADGFKKSAYFHKNRNDKDSTIHAGPVWDFDWAWKNINECGLWAVTDGSNWAHHINDCGPDVNSPAWMLRFLEDSTFTADLKCRYEMFRTQMLDTAWLFSYVDSIALLVDEAQARHYDRWPILPINVGTPEVDPQPATFAGHIAMFKNWIATRVNWLDANMPGLCVPVQTTAPKAFSFAAYPNPAHTTLWLACSEPLVQAQLFAQDGRLAHRMAGAIDQLDVSNLPSGMYQLLAVTQSGAVVRSKVVISR
jgi:subtilisin-like proprotein convertase family protein